MSEPGKVTYTTISGSEETHAAFDAAAAAVEGRFGELCANAIGGGPSPEGRERELRSPVDTRVVVGRAQRATAAEAARAIELAHAAFPAWRGLGWQRRVAILRAAAESIGERTYELAALMAWEVGKNRLEALGEVAETADLLRYYAALLEENAGYARPLARLQPHESTESVLLPYGVFGVVSPFNFPLALAGGMVGAALVAGNTVVFKPSSQAPFSGAALCRALWEAGVPADVLHLVAGDGEEVGRVLREHPRVGGLAFTGSSDVGLALHREGSRPWPRPVVVEMGGKNPAIVTARADLDAAAEGVARSAFGYGGQKCSACSRVYVEEAMEGAFLERLVERTAALVVGNPLRRETFLGPLIDAAAVGKHERAVERVREAGGEVLAGGGARRDGDLAHGHYVEPTVARLADPAHALYAEELFVPLLLVCPVADLGEALRRANDVPYGLTAGIFSADPDEVRTFLDGIEAGVLYVNRRAGATTGAWPGVNPFGGWKASGSTGPAALGPYYLLKFLREQSRTVSGV